jgi:hypothetical protein
MKSGVVNGRQRKKAPGLIPEACSVFRALVQLVKSSQNRLGCGEHMACVGFSRRMATKAMASSGDRIKARKNQPISERLRLMLANMPTAIENAIHVMTISISEVPFGLI